MGLAHRAVNRNNTHSLQSSPIHSVIGQLGIEFGKPHAFHSQQIGKNREIKEIAKISEMNIPCIIRIQKPLKVLTERHTRRLVVVHCTSAEGSGLQLHTCWRKKEFPHFSIGSLPTAHNYRHYRVHNNFIWLFRIFMRCLIDIMFFFPHIMLFCTWVGTYEYEDKYRITVMNKRMFFHSFILSFCSAFCWWAVCRVVLLIKLPVNSCLS